MGKVEQSLATKQWHHFYETIQQNAQVFLVEAKPGIPDFIFTANAALVKGKRCVLSHFKYPQRQAEEPYYKKWFVEHGYEILELPRSIYFEGEGDALFQPDTELLWMGHGMRTQKKAGEYLQKFFTSPVVLLELINESFYHLDTCFCPLRDGYVMYFPDAFGTDGIKSIESKGPKEKRIKVDEKDARQFACNTVLIPGEEKPGILIMNAASIALQNKLNALGYQLIITPVNEFIKAGGATKCLVLTLLD